MEGEEEFIRVLFVRHGEGWHNVQRQHLETQDPELTHKGHLQCVWLRPYVRTTLHLDALFVSPMRRTVQTCLLSQMHRQSERVFLCPLLIECPSYKCDWGTPKTQMVEKWPQLFGGGDDSFFFWEGWHEMSEVWWTEAKEAKEGREKRTRLFTQYLWTAVKEMQQKKKEEEGGKKSPSVFTVGVVGHGSFTRTLLKMPRFPHNAEPIWTELRCSSSDGSLRWVVLNNDVKMMLAPPMPKRSIWIVLKSDERNDEENHQDEWKHLKLQLKQAGWRLETVQEKKCIKMIAARGPHIVVCPSSSAVQVCEALYKKKGKKENDATTTTTLMVEVGADLDVRSAYLNWANVLFSGRLELASLLPRPPPVLHREHHSILIGISGPSHAGKSTLAKALAHRLVKQLHVHHKVHVVGGDAFALRSRTKNGSWDCADSVDHGRFKDVIMKLLNGDQVVVVIAEGFMSMFDGVLSARCDLRLWLDVPHHVGRARRQHTQPWFDAYDAEVWPNYQSYHAHVTKMDSWIIPARVVLDGTKPIEEVEEMAWKEVKSLYKAEKLSKGEDQFTDL